MGFKKPRKYNILIGSVNHFILSYLRARQASLFRNIFFNYFLLYLLDSLEGKATKSLQIATPHVSNGKYAKTRDRFQRNVFSRNGTTNHQCKVLMDHKKEISIVLKDAVEQEHFLKPVGLQRCNKGMRFRWNFTVSAQRSWNITFFIAASSSFLFT